MLTAEKKEAEGFLAEKQRYQDLWKEEQETNKHLAGEVTRLIQDHKRKRDRMDEVWNEMEWAVGQ